MFVSTAVARRVERSEAQLTRAVGEAAIAAGRAPRGLVCELGDGLGCYVRPGSPMNKLIGAGLDTPIEPLTLDGIEQALRARGEPARVELSTLASLESNAVLSRRGYRLVGFENVLVRSLSVASELQVPSARVERVSSRTRLAWLETTVSAVACADETGVVVDQLSVDLIESALEDMLETPGFARFLAFSDGALAGAASLRVQDGVALFTGSATLPAQRRRGVQAALIAARLAEARRHGADLAVITTAPGSQSQANVMKHGFTLAYSRAILVL